MSHIALNISPSIINFRRLKKEVLCHLPKKQRRIIEIEIKDEESRMLFREMLSAIVEAAEEAQKRKDIRRKRQKTVRNENSDSKAPRVVVVDGNEDDSTGDRMITGSAISSKHETNICEDSSPDNKNNCDVNMVIEKNDSNGSKSCIDGTIVEKLPSEPDVQPPLCTQQPPEQHQREEEQEQEQEQEQGHNLRNIPSKKDKKNMLLALFSESGIKKLPAVLIHLGKFLDSAVTGKCLIFAHHRNVLQGIADFLTSREVFMMPNVTFDQYT
jgi:hypothetical protein